MFFAKKHYFRKNNILKNFKKHKMSDAYLFNRMFPRSLFDRFHEYAPVLPWAACRHQTLEKNCEIKDCEVLRRQVVWQRYLAEHPKEHPEEPPKDVCVVIANK